MWRHQNFHSKTNTRGTLPHAYGVTKLSPYPHRRERRVSVHKETLGFRLAPLRSGQRARGRGYGAHLVLKLVASAQRTTMLGGRRRTRGGGTRGARGGGTREAAARGREKGELQYTITVMAVQVHLGSKGGERAMASREAVRLRVYRALRTVASKRGVYKTMLDSQPCVCYGKSQYHTESSMSGIRGVRRPLGTKGQE